MGIPMPPTPPEYGLNCPKGATSDPPLWALNETPKHVYASFSGIEVCPGDDWPAFGNVNGVTFKLTLVADPACHWTLNVGTLTVTWILAGVGRYDSYLYIADDTPLWWFNKMITHPTRAYSEFANGINCGQAQVSGFGGFGHVVWSPGPRKIANDFNFMKHENTMAEVFPIDEQFQVVKLCNVPMKSNCKFLFDTQYDPYQNELENFPTPWPNFQDDE